VIVGVLCGGGGGGGWEFILRLSRPVICKVIKGDH